MNRLAMDTARTTKAVPRGLDEQSTIDLNRLPVGAMVMIKTQNRHYMLQKGRGVRIYIAGHPGGRPVPITANLPEQGTGGPRIVARGMPFEFYIPGVGHVRSSPIRRVRRCTCAPLVRFRGP